MYLIIYCADIGSISAGNFGWARYGTADSSQKTSEDIAALCKSVADDLTQGFKVALGFECPLYVPFPEIPSELTKARPGEGNRPWSAGGGAGSLATGLSETLWILHRIRKSLSGQPPAFLDWNGFLQAQTGLLIWEAYVSGGRHTDSHAGDALLAVKAFAERLPVPKSDLGLQRVRSLIGAALIQAGWSRELKLLDAPCLVIKA